MPEPKPLYIASSIKDLNAKSVYNDGGRSIKTHITFADKAYNAAEEALKVLDEERAYVLFMKYLDIIKMVRKMPEYKKDTKFYNTLMGNKKLLQGLDQAEKLAKSLEKRYAAKLKKAEEAKPTVDTPAAPSTSISNSAVLEEFTFPKEKLTSQELYNLLYKKAKNVLVMDLRTADDFKASHIRHDYCINVPCGVIKPGCTPSKVEKGIDKEHFAVWNSRDSVELIILLDWTSKLSRLEDMSDPLRSLKDCIYKWDQDKTLKRCPVVLEGGFADFLDAYPQYTTNPQVKVPSFKPKTKNVNSLLDFDYDDLRLSMTPTKVEPEDASPPVAPTQQKQPTTAASIPSTTKQMVVSSSITNGLSEISASGLYPSLTTASAKSETRSSVSKDSAILSKPTVKPNAPKPQPKFDRSTKPKPTPLPQPDRKPSPEPKPVEVRKTSPVIDHSDEISEMQRRIAKMKELESETQSDLKLIEQQRQLAELKAAEAEMKKRTEELERQKKEAQKDLAVTMRGFAKPTAAKPVSEESNNSTNLPSRSHENSTTDNKPMDNKVASKEAEGSSLDVGKDRVQSAPSKQTLEVKPVVKSDSKLSDAVSEPSSTLADNSAPPSTKPVEEEKNNLNTNPILPKPYKGTPAPTPPTASKSEPSISQQGLGIDKNTTTVTPTVTASPKPSIPSENIVKTVDRSVKPVLQAPEPKPPSLTQTQPMAKPKPVQKVDAQPPKPELKRTSTPPSGGFGLKRSSSSPNIAKMVQDEASTITSKQPSIPNRVSKPRTFSREASNYEAALDRSLQGAYGGHDVKAVCGLRNLGNSCYMNSTLQCLFSTTQLAQYILKYNYREDINRNSRMGSGGKVAEGFSVLLRAAWNGQFRFIVPKEFKSIIGNIKPMFLKTTQEDAQEFLMCLLDELHEDLNRKGTSKYIEEPDNDKLSDEEAAKQAWEFHKRRNESIVVELFSGQFKAILQCVHCSKVSRKFDTFMYLSLPLPQHQASIYDVITSFTKVELLKGSDQWYCPACKTHRNAKRTIQIWKLPPVLIVHFKRFVSSGQWLDKIHTNISYPINRLDLKSYIRGPQKRNPYDLYAVSHHQGPGLDSGHYTATCKNPVNGSWYRFDDTEVYAASAPSGPTSFILFYSIYPRAVPA